MDEHEKSVKLHDFITQFWRLIKSSYEVKDDKSYWEDLINAAAGLSQDDEEEIESFKKWMLISYTEYLEAKLFYQQGKIPELTHNAYIHRGD